MLLLTDKEKEKEASGGLCVCVCVCVSYPCFFWVSSLAYPNVLGSKGYVAVVQIVKQS
jgi:hypothetical protein